MKTYIAIFWRGNPQLSSGGYETKVEIRAKTLENAKKRAKQYEKNCVYGTMTLLRIEEA